MGYFTISYWFHITCVVNFIDSSWQLYPPCSFFEFWKSIKVKLYAWTYFFFLYKVNRLAQFLKKNAREFIYNFCSYKWRMLLWSNGNFTNNQVILFHDFITSTCFFVSTVESPRQFKKSLTSCKRRLNVVFLQMSQQGSCV